MNRTSFQQQRGMTLIEVMIGLVIGMIVMLVIYQVVTTFEGQKRTTTEGAGAQENGLFAITALDRDLRMAGWGLTGTDAPECLGGIDSAASSGPMAALSLMPVRITDGGSGSDTITVTSGTSIAGNAPVQIVDLISSPSVERVVNSVIGMNRDDMVLAVNPDGSCNLGQVTSVQPGVNRIQRNPGGFNAPWSVRKSWPAEQVGTKFYNLGTLLNRTYRVNPGNGTSGAALETQDLDAAAWVGAADNIVSMKAQYGIAPTGSQVVNQWSSATGLWSAPGVTEAARIKAIRLFIVARSPIIEKRDQAGSCATTTAAPQPLWQQSATPVVVNLSSNPLWQCFRYRSFETVIPLRNVLWANS